MNVQSDPAAQAIEEQVGELLARADRLVRERRDPEALQALRAAEALRPDHPMVRHERARRMLLGGDAAGALAIFEQLVRTAPGQLTFWLSMAAALRRLQRPQEELAALEQALVIDPGHLVVLLQKAAVLDLLKRPRTAAAVYGHALQTLTPGARLAPGIEAHIAHARTRVAENSAALAELVAARVRPLLSAQSADDQHVRFDRCLDRILGRRRVFVPEPTFMLFPYLQNYEFHPRKAFPWLAQLEAHTEAIREELLGVLHDNADQVEPYIAYPQGVPLNQWAELNHSRRWGAYFLWNQAEPVHAHMARCPRTTAALAQVPQVDIPGRGPTAFFSILEPRTKIPAHCGVTNIRLTVHLPLVVPGGCRFRVGGEIREWHPGQAWVFDDTIEHEAWNDSDDARAILIFDVWNPQLTALERDLVREMTIALMEYNGAEDDTDR